MSKDGGKEIIRILEGEDVTRLEPGFKCYEIRTYQGIVPSEHYHPSRYPHGEGVAVVGHTDTSTIRCTGKSVDQCKATRVSGEISRMLEFELRKLGGNPNEIVERHMREHPADWVLA